LIFLYSKLKFKLLLSFRRYSIQNQFIGFSRHFRFLINISGSLMLVKFSKNFRLIEPGGFLGRGVDISGNLRLLDLSGFSRF
jgi:hypothetical protein